MTKHKTGTREEWLAKRLELLKAEKELTDLSDEVTQRRQELPCSNRQGLSIRNWRRKCQAADLFKDARSSSCTTSCSGRITLRVARLFSNCGRLQLDSLCTLQL